MRYFSLSISCFGRSLLATTASTFYRLDVDAGFDNNNNKFSVGAIIRDYQGAHAIINSVTKGAHAIIIRNPGSVDAAEILAIRWGMDLCLHIGLSNVCIYSDSSEAVRAALHPAMEFGPLGVLAIESIPYFYQMVSCR